MGSYNVVVNNWQFSFSLTSLEDIHLPVESAAGRAADVTVELPDDEGPPIVMCMYV